MFILDCSEVRQMCYNVKPVLEVIKYFIKIIQWSVPLLLIILGTWDMFKAITKADDSKVVEEAKKSFIKRLIYGVVLFLIPFLVRLVLNFIENNFVLSDDTTSPTSWISCWNDVMNNESFSDCNDIYKKDISSSEDNN